MLTLFEEKLILFLFSGVSLLWHWSEYQLIDSFEISIKNLSNKVLYNDEFQFEEIMINVPGSFICKGRNV